MNSKKNLKRNLLICLLAGSAVMYTLPLHAATSVIGNGTLPQNGQFVGGSAAGSIVQKGDLQLDVSQKYQNAVIKWDSFDVGGSATVNFSAEGAYANNFNTLNYINSGAASQIYGTINAQGGNIFIVNPAGVQIGNSAQINVGSLYVSNKNLDDAINKLFDDADKDETGNFYQTIGLPSEIMANSTNTDAVLMSLGNINASEVTFEGDGRIVIDTERIKKNDIVTDNFIVKTDDVNDVLLGYDAYNTGAIKDTYAGKDKTFNDNVLVNGQKPTEDVKGYMWVEDVKQLQAIDTNLGGNYALRNSIDATGTAQKSFKPIGSDGNAFYGKFDGIDYNIFGLNIDNNGKSNIGLFGETNGAVINNVTLVGGKIVGGNNTGALIGHAINTTVTNVVNSAEVNGNINVGGIIGASTGSVISNAINTGSVNSNGGSDNNGGTVSSAGGLIGAMYKGSKLIGNSYNLGDVSGKGHNVGGLVGSASNSTIGNPSIVNGKPVENIETVYNRMDVTGAYNVGGIVGNMTGSIVQNAENSGTVLASGYNDNGEYIFHTDNAAFDGEYGETNDKLGKKVVNVANAGGIAGTSSVDSTITDVLNTGDVSSSKVTNNDYYDAGNVGGIVGSAVDTNITNATNQENEIRGAHNVGGIAGHFGSTKGDSTDKDTPHYTVTNGINDGGDIMATGARNENGFVKEQVRSTDTGAEETIIGNMGGVVGYLDGDNVYVTGSANRGTVHSLDITGDTVSQASQASNTGGVVGKIDRSYTLKLSDLQGKDTNGNDKIINAAVSNSYNTGDVRGYMGVGGVVGMMYNGEVAGSYNLGSINTTRRAADAASNAYPSVNMGGVVGDTTEQTTAKALIYDVYNKGQIGDETYNYYARHVGGVVGRLSGDVEKAYNTGAIYNGYNVVGGIAGWFYTGSINNSFNTGNITVINHDTTAGSQVGGIVGGVGLYSDTKGSTDSKISNAYNLGTIRSFAVEYTKDGTNQYTENQIGGIIGFIMENVGHDLTVENVYTTGNLYAGRLNEGENYSGLGSIIGVNDAGGGRVTVTNAYYIKPAKDENDKPLFTVLTGNRDNSNKAIDFDQKSDLKQYKYTKDGQDYSLSFSTQADGSGNVEGNTDNNWRIYGGNTPILNAFLPDAEGYFSDADNMDGISDIQYGTAYDPLLTIINAANGTNELKYNWQDLGISNAAGLVVYGAGLTLGNVNTSGGSGYFGGTIYADGALNLNGGKNDIGLGSAADIYGSAVNITTGGKVTIYGDVTATGNTANGATSDKSDVIDVKDKGNITISASDVDVYGTLTSAEQGSSVVVSGIEDQAVQGWKPGLDIGDEEEVMSDIADRFAHTTGASDVDGNITIIAKTKLVVDDNDEPILDENGNKQYIGGNVNLYYGNKEQGLITTGGNLTVTGTGDVYVDSDLSIGGGLSLTAGADKEIVLDISNIGQVQNNHNNTEAVKTLHKFLGQFGEGNAIKFNGTDDAKITVDMWQGDAFDLDKFDTGKTFGEAIAGVKVNVEKNENIRSGRDITHIWVSSGEQLKNIQTYAKNNSDSKILSYNFALKGDINASNVKDYVAIGTGNKDASGNEIGFTGTFDGRGNRIIGLKVENANGNAGIFDTIGTNGVVKDVNIYSGTFTGTTTAGAVAGVNNGRIEGIVTFGNTVTSNGNAGGIVGINSSGEFKDDANDGELTNGIYDVESTGSVIAGSSSAVAGGLVGINDGGLANSFSDSAVTVATGVKLDKDTTALGGVVGINNGNVQYVDSLGVTNGGATGSSNIGGIIGTNNGNMYSGYNESIVSGNDNVGGIIGENDGGINYTLEEDGTVTWSKGTVENVVNATGVTGTGNNVGGLLGTNIGSVENGRNNGAITGNDYVGGLVGINGENSTLTNLVNDSSAAITGEQYVGGIAGSNAGTITTGNEETDETVNLINRGTITGQQYVGGVAGSNSGTITNANNDVELNVKDSTADAQYFGGIAGVNTGTINKATNTADVNADGADYVGGIVGKNDGTLKDMAGNSGTVTGGEFVGGVAGLNTNNKPLDGVEASNTGTVFATDGGAGGIFAVNNADITNSKLTNNGAVIGNGGNGTGGIFGVNTGNISTSSLINEVDGQVIGTNNVGGLIGKNTGTIIGGRDDADSYYKYQIYNNGVINVGTYIYNNKNGEYEFQVDTGSNIGGLIGNNTTENGKTGSLTAGYNTGAINASGSTNVGGIAGSNSGTIDQVFNTVMVKPGSNQDDAIEGGKNVGGLVGNNSGILNNAYNTTSEVKGNAASTGNLVGTNSDTVQYVYGVADKLIGDGKTAENGYVIDGSDTWLQEGIYEDFTFGANGWKIYDGSTLPMLSVFLTKVTVVDQHLVDQYFSAKHYGEFHQITADDIKALIAIGAISAPDGFDAFNNNNGLIQGVADDAMANSGNWLYSWQIGSSNINGLFNPNNLGYDISLVYSPFELDNDPSSRWNYLFNDAPFDRNKDFRERKAEVNFVDGGMEI